MKSSTHDHITQEVERIGQRHAPESEPIFAARLKDGTFLPCLRAYPAENHTVWIRPPSGDPYLQFDAVRLGTLAYAHCIVHGDNIESVEQSPYFLPKWLHDRLIAAHYRGDYFALRIRMKDTKEFTLMEGLGMSCYAPPPGYSWDDIEETVPGYDHNPVNPINPMIEFRCILVGLSHAKIREAESIAATIV